MSGDCLSLCRLCERDPYQLYQRLEQQAREYVLEMKVRLLRQLSAAARVRAPSGLQGPPQAHQFISLLLEEYGALCQAARTISTFLGTLVREPAFLWLCWALGAVWSGEVRPGVGGVRPRPSLRRLGSRGSLTSLPSSCCGTEVLSGGKW